MVPPKGLLRPEPRPGHAQEGNLFSGVGKRNGPPWGADRSRGQHPAAVRGDYAGVSMPFSFARSFMRF